MPITRAFLFYGKILWKVIFIPRVTYEQAAKEFADHGYTLLDHDVMATKKMAYTCNKHPDKPPQHIDLSHLRRGQGCKYCREGRRSNHSVNKDTVIKLCEDRAFEFVNLRSDGTKSIIDFICEKHQDKGVQSMDLQTLRKCHGCRYCAGKGRTTASFVKELNKSNIEILGAYKKASEKIKCRCKIDDTIWYPTPMDLLHGQGCPTCGRISSANKRRKTTECFYKEVAEKNPTIEPIGEYSGIFNKMQFRCKICSTIWTTIPDRIINAKCKCPKCIAYKNENKIISILERWGYNVQTQKRFNDCRDKNPLPFDLYIPENNILIEYDGEQHYKPIRRGNTEHDSGETLLKYTHKHDLIKTEYCKTHGIPLIRIPYWEADNMESFLFDEMVRCGAIEEIIAA